MIPERKSNVYDQLIEIIKSAVQHQNIYNRVGVVRDHTLPTYTIELTNELFDKDKPNEDNYIYDVENLTNTLIPIGEYVYLCYLTNDLMVIFQSKSDTEQYIFGSSLVQLSGQTINIETTDGSIMNMDDKITLETPNGAIFNMDTKITIENNTENFADLMEDLVDYILQMTFPSPAGTTGTCLNFASFTAWKASKNNLFE